MEFNDKDSQLIEIIVDKVRNQKKYKTIAEEVITSEVKSYFKKNPGAKDNKDTIKQIRSELHKSYSSFQTKKKKKREHYLEELKQNPDSDEIQDNLLSITVSTKERIPYYKDLYQKIFKITGNPKTIVDLGCGLNPLSYPLMNLGNKNGVKEGAKPLAYYAYDIDEEDMNFLNDYFKIMNSFGLNGKAAIMDVRNIKSLSCLPPTDIIFLFKVLDIIDRENHKPSEELIQQLIKKTRFIVASFATKTLTKKQMRYPKRKWFELMLERLDLKYKTIETFNEIYYIISVSNFK